MIGHDEQGGTVFTIHAPGAEVVELTARFGGDHERTLAMRRCGDGGWSLRLHPGLHCTTYRFRVDGRFLADQERCDAI
jgi:1,4-alpha-glucan branching enzyme